MKIRDLPGADRVKVSQLKAGENNLIHLFVDGVGELAMITRKKAERLLDEAGEKDRHGDIGDRCSYRLLDTYGL